MTICHYVNQNEYTIIITNIQYSFFLSNSVQLYLNWLKAQIQCNYFKPKRPKNFLSLVQNWVRGAHGLDTIAVYCIVLDTFFASWSWHVFCNLTVLIWMCAGRSGRLCYGPRQRHRRQRPHASRVLWRVRTQADNTRTSARSPGRWPHAAPDMGVANPHVRARPAVPARRGPLALHAGHHDGRGPREALLQVTRRGALDIMQECMFANRLEVEIEIPGQVKYLKYLNVSNVSRNI